MARARPLAVGEETPGERLLIEAAQRDPLLFAELYENNFDRVYAYVSTRVRDRGEVQDVTADVFHHALENLGKFEWRGVPFIAWLYRIAANAIVDRAKRAAREQPGDPPETGVDPDFDEIDERAQVSALLKDLPPDQLRVVVLRFMEEQSLRDVAKEMGRTEGAVKQLQFRALQNLRNMLGERNG
jgi:RNA polymerase sigma-70 factor (ECF subfamily)